MEATAEDSEVIERNDKLLKDKEYTDDLQRNGLVIIQSDENFKFGMDAVLLSGYANIHKGDRVIDLCSGNGIIPLLLYAKTQAEHIVGLEIQENMTDMARRSAEYNSRQHEDINERLEFVCADVNDVDDLYEKGSFDAITCNPPYMKAGHGLKNVNDSKSIARHEVKLTLKELISAASYLLKDKGRIYMVHRPFRLTEIIEQMHRNNIEAKRMRLVYPFADKEPNMILIEGIKGAKPYLVAEKPLIIYESEGVYTKELMEEYGY